MGHRRAVDAASRRARQKRDSIVAPDLVVRSRALRGVLADVRRMAAGDSNVLITGETGVGKNLIARTLHSLSWRHDQPFVEIDCPSLPAMLMESELFGHERGAFTDATTARQGRFEAAGRGTIYLDRVGELPVELQGKLLRVVDEKRGERLGGNQPFEVLARIVASASADLHDAVREGRFREDLYHRLRVLPLHVPALRERPADILPLARDYLRRAAGRLSRPALELSHAAVEALLSYPWPGNVRELQHALEHALIGATSRRIEIADLPPELFQPTDPPMDAAGRQMTLEELERRYIEATLRRAGGNQTRAAAILGISRKALWERRKRYGYS